ncbi:MAG: putative quinol monooxygenase [Hyphomicrobiaceae bacterium]
MLKSLIVAAVLAGAATVSVAQETKPVVVLVKVFASAGRGDELQTLYVKRLNYLRKAEPDATFRVHRSTKDPDTFLWYEVYPSKAAYEKHVKVVMANFKKEAGPTPAGIIARPSESETFTEFGQ